MRLFFSFHGAIRPVGLSSDGLTLFLSPTYLLVAIAMFLASSATLLVLHACFAGGVGLACSQSHYGLWLFGVIVIVIVKASSKWLLGLRACTLTIV